MTTRVILLVGCSGSGKSTYAKQKFPKAMVVSADHYFELIARRARKSYGEVFDTWQLRAAHSGCQVRFSEALAARKPIVIVDNTNVRRADRQRYVKMAMEAGCETEFHVFSPWVHENPPPSNEEVLNYVSNCYQCNVHGVPLEVISQQFTQLELPAGIFQAGKPPRFIQALDVEDS